MNNSVEHWALRERLHCHSFDRYLRNVHPNLFAPSLALASGKVSRQILISMGKCNCHWVRITLSSFCSFPAYLLELFILTSAYSGRRSLCLASRGDFVMPLACTDTRQKRAFSIVGPSVWNSLPSDLCSLDR